MMTVDSVDKLVPELYDYIIDFLHDNNAALRACALVCRSWVPASRSHLFYHLVLTGSPSITHSWAPNTSCRRIFAAMLYAPYLASYVHKLSIREPVTVSRSKTYRWASEEISFPPLLKKLSNLRELEFNFPAPGPAVSKTIWSTMVFKDISDVMSSLTLDSLTIRQFSFSTLPDFVKILDSCQHLKTLQFDNVDISTGTHLSTSGLDHVLSLQPINSAVDLKADLEHLLLRSDSSSLFIHILLHERSPINLSTLQSLIINVTSDNYPSVIDLLRVMPNLESLELEIESSLDFEAHLDHDDIIDLHLLPSLCSLTLQSSLLLARMDPLPWLIAIFSTARSDNTLNTLALTFTIDKPPPTLTIQAFQQALAGWHDLDGLLTQDTFASLQRVRLDFALDNPIGDDTLAQVADEFVKELQGLARKGVLEVDAFEVR